MDIENFNKLEGVDTINALSNLLKESNIDDDFLKDFGDKIGIKT